MNLKKLEDEKSSALYTADNESYVKYNLPTYSHLLIITGVIFIDMQL